MAASSEEPIMPINASSIPLRAVARKIGSPLHAQVRHALRELIQTSFKDGDRFFSERELIDQLNVSQPTVRRALTELTAEGLIVRGVGKGTFVRKNAKERSVGVIVPDIDSPVVLSSIRSLASACARRDLGFHLYHLQKTRSIQEVCKGLHRSPLEERIVYCGTSAQTTWELFQALDANGYRSLYMGAATPGFPGSWVHEDVEGGVITAINHLTSLGHRRICFLINEPKELPTAQLRLDTVKKLQSAGKLGPELTIIDCNTQPWGNSYKSAYAAMPEVMALDPQPTAICPVSGIGAWGVLRYLSEHRIRVPEEVSLFSFDNLPGSDLIYPSLTALTNAPEHVERVLDMLWNDDPRPQGLVVPLQLVVRESTGPARE